MLLLLVLAYIMPCYIYLEVENLQMNHGLLRCNTIRIKSSSLSLKFLELDLDMKKSMKHIILKLSQCIIVF